MLVDFAVICASFLGAYLLFVDGRVTEVERAIFLSALPVLLAVRYVLFVVFGIYRCPRFATARDLVAIVAAVGLSVPITVAIVARPAASGFPLEIFVVDALLCAMLVGGVATAAAGVARIHRGWAETRAGAGADRRCRPLGPRPRTRARRDL